jgi:hypothetical protein
LRPRPKGAYLEKINVKRNKKEYQTMELYTEEGKLIYLISEGFGE